MEGTVTDIANQDDYKEVHLEDGSVIETKAVIVATGATHRKLGVEGEAKFAGAVFRTAQPVMVHFSGIKR